MLKKTLKSLKTFAAQFSEEEWARLCTQQMFLDCVLDDLDAAKNLAALTFPEKYNKPE